MADPEQGPTWYAATAAARPERPRLTFDLDVDVCVVGGGLAGLTAAREVARRGWSVAVLETGRLADGASGRNMGVVRPGFAQPIDKIIARVGLTHARALWELSERGVDYVRRTIDEAGLSQAEPRAGCLHVFRNPNGDRAIELFRLIGEEFGAAVEGWPAERVRAVLKSDLYFHALHYPRAFHIHPLNYALGLAAAAEAAGVRIFEQTPALAIDAAGVRKRVTTPAARVRAAHVVLAGGAHLGGLMPRLAATVMPVTSYVITSAPLGDRLAEAVAYSGAVSDSEGTDRHYRIVAGGRLQWSGRTGAWRVDPRRVARGLVQDVERVYPQLGRIAVDHAWCGTTAVPVHLMPQIGEVGSGLWVANGFAGHGLNTTAMAGEVLARAIVENDETWRLFLPFELVWAGGVLGRAVVQGLTWSARLRETVAHRLAGRDAHVPAFAGAALAPVVMPDPELAAPSMPAAPTADAARKPRRSRSGNGAGRRIAGKTGRKSEKPVRVGEGAERALQDDDRSGPSAP